MKIVRCQSCGANELVEKDGYMVCTFCNTRYTIEKEDLGIKTSSISLDSDIDILLKKCESDPKNAKKYANLILDIDPDNEEAIKYLY